MSKKKEKRIKRLQKMPIWPAVLEMIITELVIFSLTIFICAFSLFGMINTVVLNMMKTCRSAVELVNENWSGQNLEAVNTILSDFAANHIEINEAFILKREDFSSVIPQHKMHIEYDEDDTVTDLDSTFYEGLTHAKRIRYLESIQKNYGHYGYGGIGGFLVFYYNTPNSTLPMVWYSKEGWLPLFARKFDLKNI